MLEIGKKVKIKPRQEYEPAAGLGPDPLGGLPGVRRGGVDAGRPTRRRKGIGINIPESVVV